MLRQRRRLEHDCKLVVGALVAWKLRRRVDDEERSGIRTAALRCVDHDGVGCAGIVRQSPARLEIQPLVRVVAIEVA